jgi:VanZ family protein
MLCRTCQLLFWSSLAFAFVMATLPPAPLPLAATDKALHALAFSVLAAFLAPAYPRASLLFLFLSLAAFGALIEGVQAIPALGRTPSLEDWIVDVFSAAAVLAFIAVFRRIRRPSAA